MKVRVTLPGATELIRKKGLDKEGRVQRFHTQNVCNRIRKYMPNRTGVLSSKLTKMQSGTEIKVEGPYAHYQYTGEVWGPNIPIIENGIIVGYWSPPNKHPTGKSLEYFKGKNPQAGPFWDRRLMAAEGDTMRADLQRFIDRGTENV